MADYTTEKLPPQQWFTEQVRKNPPSYFDSQAAGYADASNKVRKFFSLGYLPTAQETIASSRNIPEEGVNKLMRASQEINPTNYGFGQVLGYVAEPITAGLGVAKAAAQPLVYSGYQALRNMLPAFGTSAKVVGGVSTAASVPMVGDYLMPGKVYPSQTAPAASAAPVASPGDLAAVERARANNAESTRIADERRAPNSFLASLGLSEEQGRALQAKYGGIPVGMIDKLAGARPTAPKPPGFREVAFDVLMQNMESELQALERSGASEDTLRKYRRDGIIAGMERVLGADAFGKLSVPEE